MFQALHKVDMRACYAKQKKILLSESFYQNLSLTKLLMFLLYFPPIGNVNN